jgi:hypothetical protein
MPGVGFQPTIPASERAKTVHALDRYRDRQVYIIRIRKFLTRTKIAAVMFKTGQC